MSEKCLLRLDTKSVMRKSVKVVKAKRYKLQWCACARPREGRGLQYFLKFLFVLPCDAFQRRGYPSNVLQRKATLRLLNRPRLWNRSPLFRKKLPRFLKKLHRFRENLLRFWENLPRFFSPLLRVELHFFWRGERNHEFLGFQIRCVEARKHFMIDIFRISSSLAQQHSLGAKKIPLIAGWMGFFIIQRSADYRIKDAIKRCLRANRKE